MSAVLPGADPRPGPRRPVRGLLGRPSILLAFAWFDQRVYRGIARFATKANWHLSPYFFTDRHLPGNWPGDGALTCYGRTIAPFVDALDMPVVDISFLPMPRPTPRVRTDNALVGVRAARHFLERGFRHFAFYRWSAVAVNVARHEAFAAALEQAGVAPPRLHVIEQPRLPDFPDWTVHQRAILDQVVRLPRPLAVFTGQDSLAAELVEVCIRNGIRVPEEVAVVGVDNNEILCECMAVPLSSVDTRLEELGYAAAHQLQRLLDGEIGPDEPPRLVPPGDVVCRRSSEFLAVSHPAVAEALRIMRAEFATPLTLVAVCERVGLSRRAMEKAFQRELRCSPASELRRIRLDRARRLLSQTDLKVEAVASESGYGNSSNLSLALRRETGLSPRDYRRRFRPGAFGG